MVSGETSTAGPEVCRSSGSSWPRRSQISSTAAWTHRAGRTPAGSRAGRGPRGARKRLPLAAAGRWCPPVPRRAALEQRQLAHREREVLGQSVVDLRRQPQALALDRPALEILAQVGGRDAGGEQVAEQAEQGAAMGSSDNGRAAAAIVTPINLRS